MIHQNPNLKASYSKPAKKAYLAYSFTTEEYNIGFSIEKITSFKRTGN
jgi:hypothetical protein